MEQTTTILYDFWQFMFFSVLFTGIVAYFSYKSGYQNGAQDLFNDLVNQGVIEIEEEESDEDIY